VGTSYGSIALVHELVRQVGLAQAIDERVHRFRMHLPQHESNQLVTVHSPVEDFA